MGRGDPCTANSISAPASVPVGVPGAAPGVSLTTSGAYAVSGATTTSGQLIPRDQRMPWNVVSVGGETMAGGAGSDGYGDLVTRIRVREAADHLMSMAEVTLANPYQKFTDEAKFVPWSEMEINLGFKGTGLVKREKFITLQPRYVFPSETDETPSITLIGVGQEMLLSRTEKRRIWPKMRESEIARKIAEEYGWDADVKDTETLLEDVTQSSTTDWHLLDKMARHHGYSLYVENDVLHFHPPRYRNTGLQFMYAGDAANLTSFIVQGETLHSGVKMTFTQINPLKKESFEVNSQEVVDEVTTATKAAFSKPTQMAKAIASYKDKQPEHFVYEEGHEQTQEYMQRLVEGFSQHTRWLMQGEGELVGFEEIKPRDVIEIMGVGKHSGQYYVTDTEHLLDDGVYTTSFHVARTWEGMGTGSTFVGTKTVQLQQVTS